MSRKEFLEVLFDIDHISTCGTNDAGATKPAKRVFPNLVLDRGVKFSINPIISNRDTKNVLEAGLYSMLFEMDKDSHGNLIPRATQIDLFNSSDLPYSTMMWSGTKSVHVIVRMDRPIPELLFKPLWSAISRVLTKWGCSLDPATEKIPQISRMPESIRRVDIKDEAGNIIGHKKVKQDLIEVRQRVSLKELGQWLKKNGETVHKPKPTKPYVPIKTDKSNLDKFKIAKSWSEKKHGPYLPSWSTGGWVWFVNFGVNLRKLDCDLNQAIQFAHIEWGLMCETGLGKRDIMEPITKGWTWLDKKN